MTIGRTNSGSGGGFAKAYAIIRASFPSGSTCICTDGNKTLRAKDTSGDAFFPVPYAGSWTVSCTDGTKTASKSVVISTQYQVEDVTLIYRTYLYDTGDECIAVSGGWQGRALKVKTSESAVVPTVTKGASTITAKVSNSGKGGVLEIINDFDLSDYSTLYFDIDSTSRAQYNGIGLVVFDRSITSFGWPDWSTNTFPNATAYYAFPQGSFSGIKQIDVSALSASYDIGVALYCGSSAAISIALNSVYAE